MKTFAAVLLCSTAFVAFASPVLAAGKIIAMSWNNFQEERWAKWDEPAIKAVIEANGDTYISSDAQSSAAKQLTDIESLISQGADAIIILAQDQEAILPAVAAANAEGIGVVAYDRLFEAPGAFYLTFDNKEVGRMEARAILEVMPKGNYVFIKGNAADPNADFLFEGQMEVLKEAMDRGDIVNVGESYTDNWATSVAQKNMEQILTANNNNVDAVVASNDSTAAGVVAALAAQGMAGSVPVSGQDGEQAALNRVALGTQTVTVWKDARALGKAAAEVATALANGASVEAVEGAVKFSGGPKGVEMNSIFLAPVPVTAANLDLVLDAGWITKEALCQGVPAGKVAVCG